MTTLALLALLAASCAPVSADPPETRPPCRQVVDQAPAADPWFDSVNTKICGDASHMVARRYRFVDGDVYQLDLIQDPDGATACYTVRTPVGQKDISCWYRGSSLAALVALHPELLPMLDDARAGMGQPPYALDAVVYAQAGRPSKVPADVAERVAEILPRLDAPDWRDRELAERDIEAMGSDAAVCLVGLDRWTLTPQQRMAVDRIVARRSGLTSQDIESFRGQVETAGGMTRKGKIGDSRARTEGPQGQRLQRAAFHQRH